MKTQVKANNTNTKLSLNKQKIANLSVQEMSKINGGKEAPVDGGGDRSNNSTRADFTCCMCTTL